MYQFWTGEAEILRYWLRSAVPPGQCISEKRSRRRWKEEAFSRRRGEFRRFGQVLDAIIPLFRSFQSSGWNEGCLSGENCNES